MTDFQGVNVASITPRGRHGELDLGAFFELIDHLCKAGVQGILLFGESGEYPAFTAEERSRLVYLALKRSRVPLLVGVGSTSLDTSVELARSARERGAAGLLLPPPFWFSLDVDDLKEFYRQYAIQTGAGDITLIANSSARPDIALDTAMELLSGHVFAGMVDHSDNPESFSCLCAAAAGHSFQVLCANDRLFTRARNDRRGSISVAACAVPEVALALDRVMVNGNRTEFERLDAGFAEFRDWMDRFPPLTVVKTALELRGIKTGPPSLPLSCEKQALLARFREWFQGWFPAVKRMAVNA